MTENDHKLHHLATDCPKAVPGGPREPFGVPPLMAKRSTGWLAGWLVGWLAGWLPGWLAGPPLPETPKNQFLKPFLEHWQNLSNLAHFGSVSSFRGQGLIFDLPGLNLSLQA